MNNNSNTSENNRKIVVGVDGSEASHHALVWAAKEAQAHNEELDIVHVWSLPAVIWPSLWGGMTVMAPITPPKREEVENYHKEVLDQIAKEANAITGSSVTLHPMLEEGNPAEVLLRIAKDADLLIVGSRGHGGFAGLRLGSVSSHCIHHAACPIVVVPAEHEND